MYELYQFNTSRIDEIPKPSNTGNGYEQYECGVFKPSFGQLQIQSISKSFKGKLINLYWYIITLGRFRIYYVRDGETIIHTSCCATKCYKFPFMERNDVHVGPCTTDSRYRGQGIYPYVLSRIIQDYAKCDKTFYMIIHDDNISSQKGVHKVGFKKTAALSRSNFLKIYRIIDEGVNR